MNSPRVEPHRIRRAVFDLLYPSESAAFEARKRLQDLFAEAILPAIEECLDHHFPDHRYRSIDRAEIDLGRLELQQLQADRLRELIYRGLAGVLPQLTALEDGSSRTPPPVEEILAGFLETGRFPWLAAGLSLAEVEEGIWQLGASEVDQLVGRLRGVLRDPAVCVRLVSQLSSRFVDWLLPRLHPAAPALLSGSPLRIGPKPAKVEAPSAPTLTFPAAVVHAASTVPQDSPPRALKARLLELLQTQPPREATGTKPVTLPSDPPISATPTPPTEETLYTAHAGIVLLHPFLIRFFQELRLLDQRDLFVSHAARENGVHLLYYLSTGKEQPPEHETVLHKLLCGFPLQSPVSRKLRLTRRQKSEAQSLLKAAIGHWRKLKSTSPEGLREGFLQREGKLIPLKTGWELIVEQRGIDVLLGYLPWSISRLELPWMDAPLVVEWA